MDRDLISSSQPAALGQARAPSLSLQGQSAARGFRSGGQARERLMSSVLNRLFRLVAPQRVRELAALPGPPPEFPAGNAWRFLTSWPWEVCAELGERYGPIFVVWLLHRPYVVLNDASLAREVLETRADAYYKADPVRALLPLSPCGNLFLANGAQWQHLRQHDPLQAVDPRSFLADQVPAARRLIRERVAELLESTAECPVELTATLQRIVFDVLAVCLVGDPLGDAAYDDFTVLSDAVARRVYLPPLAVLPPLSPGFYAARSRWERTFGSLIDRARREADPARRDLLHAALPKDSALSHDDFRAALAGMFHGGVHSLTSAVANTLSCLGRDADAVQRVSSEVRTAMYGPRSFDLQSLDTCRQLDAALRETLRLWPPVPMFLRNVDKQRETTLGGYRLPPNTSLIISPWVLHRSETHWPFPEQYRPQRWLEGAAETDPLGSDYFFPFGRGPRTCSGQRLGLFVMKLMLATLLAEADVRIRGPCRHAFHLGVMLPRGLQARFLRRR